MSVSYLLPVCLGVMAMTAAIAAALLQRRMHRHDRAVPSDSDSNPYRPPSELESLSPSILDGFEDDPDPPFSRMIVLPFACGGSGAVTGVVSRLCRPLIGGPIHYEAIAALLILVTFSLVLVFVNRTTRPKLAHLLFQLENFSLSVGFACGWTIIQRGIWSDFIFVSLAQLACTALVGSLLLLGFQRLRRRMLTS